MAPHLKECIDTYRSLGYYTIKHTDGNINPILDQIVACGPDALHSIDPQGGMSLAEVRKKYGDRVCTIGNVNCGLLQTGTDEEAAEDVRRCLREGMDGNYGFIFSTSNCVYTGMPLERYDLMQQIWEKKPFTQNNPSLSRTESFGELSINREKRCWMIGIRTALFLFRLKTHKISPGKETGGILWFYKDG